MLRLSSQSHLLKKNMKFSQIRFLNWIESSLLYSPETRGLSITHLESPPPKSHWLFLAYPDLSPPAHPSIPWAHVYMYTQLHKKQDKAHNNLRRLLIIWRRKEKREKGIYSLSCFKTESLPFRADTPGRFIWVHPAKNAGDEYAYRIPHPYTTLVHQGKGTQYPR